MLAPRPLGYVDVFQRVSRLQRSENGDDSPRRIRKFVRVGVAVDGQLLIGEEEACEGISIAQPAEGRPRIGRCQVEPSAGSI